MCLHLAVTWWHHCEDVLSPQAINEWSGQLTRPWLLAPTHWLLPWVPVRERGSTLCLCNTNHPLPVAATVGEETLVLGDWDLDALGLYAHWSPVINVLISKFSAVNMHPNRIFDFWNNKYTMDRIEPLVISTYAGHIYNESMRGIMPSHQEESSPCWQMGPIHAIFSCIIRIMSLLFRIKKISIIQKKIRIIAFVQLSMLTWLYKASLPVDHKASLEPMDTCLSSLSA